jgi:hypothetical protein
MPISRCKIDDYKPANEPWVIEGFIASSLSLWTGEPKMGKSLLAGHAAYALIQGTEFLGRKPSEREHLIGWMGFDPGWKEELSERWSGKTRNSIFLYDSLRDMKKGQWEELALVLKNDGVTVLFIDHLYGIAGSSLLNDANEVYKVYDLLRPIYEGQKIPVVLIHQAGKGFNNKGRAANSVAIEGEARTLVRISGKAKPNLRKIEIVANQGEMMDFKIALDPEVCELSSIKGNQEKREYKRESPHKVKEFFTKAMKDELSKGWKGAGRCLFRLGFSVSEDAGRAMARSWGKQGLLLRGDGGQIIPGPTYDHWILNTREDAA